MVKFLLFITHGAFCRTQQKGFVHALLFFILISSGICHAQGFDITASSYLGGISSSEQVMGSAILSNGNIVLAANVDSIFVEGLTPILLNGATSGSMGAILRLSPDGKTLLSITRVSEAVSDLSIDASDRLYVAAGGGGALVLDSAAATVLAAKTYTKKALRIDASPSGRFAVLISNSPFLEKTITGAEFHNYDDSWEEAGRRGDVSQYSVDVCIDEVSQTVIGIGFKNIHADDDSQLGNNPVDIAVYKGWSYDGTVKYIGYDWNGTPGDPRWLNAPENNMADTRGARCEIGGDGKLYMAFAVDGGNIIMRYDPFDITKRVKIEGGDEYHALFNTRTEKKTFFGRYDPGTGTYLKGQGFCARRSDGWGNTAHPEQGEISADASGRVYLVGTSASGLPLTTDPLPNTYTGGAFILVMSPDFRTRQLCTRVAEHFNSPGHALAQRNGKIVMGGTVVSDRALYTENAIDDTANQDDGFFTVFNGSEIPNLPPTVSITAPADSASFEQGDDITITASAKDSIGSVSKVQFFNGTVFLGEDDSAPYSYKIFSAAAGDYSFTAVALDDGGSTTVSSPVYITVNPVTGCAGENVALNKTVLSKSGDSEGSEAELLFDGSIETKWSIEGLPTPQYVEVDLGSLYSVNRTEVVTHQGRAYQYKVEVKNDLSGDYSTLVDRTSNIQGGTEGQPILDTFTPVEARYLKVTVTGVFGYSGAWVSISELRLYTVCTASPVVITAPSDGTVFERGDSIAISASVTDTVAVAQVEFFNNDTTSLGVDYSAPYSITISNTDAGAYRLSAVATDSAGTAYTSSHVSITVNSAIISSIKNAFEQIEAEGLDGQSGLEVDAEGFSGFDTGDWVRYDSVDFGQGAGTFNAYLGTDNAGGQIEVRLDSMDGTLIGILAVTDTGGESTFQLQSTVVSGATGIHNLYLVGAGGDDVAYLDHFVFKHTTPSTGNPVTAYYGQGNYGWTDSIQWSNAVNILDFGGVPDETTDNLLAFDSAAANVSKQGGGVVYFPAGTYYFGDDLLIPSGVVILGDAPASGMDDAKQSSFNLATKFSFPKYNFVETADSSANSTAFKSILLDPATATSASNVGVVYVDINRAGIFLEAADKQNATGENAVVFGVRTNNVALPTPGVPKTSVGQKAYQRHSYRFGANVQIYNKKNVLVANTRSNDAITDNYAYNSYIVDNSSSPMDLTDGKAVFNYTDHYVIVVGQGNGGCSAAAPSSCPENFREGIDIRDNWMFHTMRVALHARGQGLQVRDNVVRDSDSKTAWVDATGTKLVADNNTLENRGIDWGGWDVTISGNDVQVFRHTLKTGPHKSLDGEGILLQECCGGTTVNGVEIVDNIANSYIGLYKVRDINDAYIADNTLSTGMTDVSLIYISANTNATEYKIENTVVENNDLSGSKANIAFKGSDGEGSGNFIRNNTSTGGTIDFSCATNVVVSGNTGFTFADTCDTVVTALNQNDLANQISVYPNPSKGSLYVKMPLEGAANIQVFNTFGKIVYYREKVINHEQLEIKSLSAGLYYMAIEIKGRVTTKKIVMQ